MTEVLLPPLGFRVASAQGVSTWRTGRIIVGGSPWRVAKLASQTVDFLAALRVAGAAGVAIGTTSQQQVVRRLLDRGLVDPVVMPRPGPHPVSVVVPAYDRIDLLRSCLAAIEGADVLVVDDASRDEAGVRATAEQFGARVVRHVSNGGPAAGRNTGISNTTNEFIAFVDSDCTPEPGWLDLLLPHFDDPAVAVVAPRIRPETGGRSLLARYEAARSALDMGDTPQLVVPGARLGFVPTAAVVVRRDVLLTERFDEQLRLGEDVDFVWRVADSGRLVRYEPLAHVTHAPLTKVVPWLRRRYDYGTSAASLSQRHPVRLAPVRPSVWSLAVLGLFAARRPGAGLAVGVTAAGLLCTRLRPVDGGVALAATIVAKGVVADGAAVGHVLRREWWPLGAACLLGAPRSRVAQAGAFCMLAPIAWELMRKRPRVDPLSYTALRLIDDAAYGTGVISSSARARTIDPLRPRVQWPTVEVAAVRRLFSALRSRRG